MRYISGVSTLTFDEEKCTGCGRCSEVCPHGVFEVEDKEARITDLDMCMECGACKENCAFGAIDVEAGVGCAFALINSMLYGGEPSCDCSGGPEGSGGASCC
jgi:NAD-dependent dihydropyrimidine dehydrogenase PreA subunit